MKIGEHRHTPPFVSDPGPPAGIPNHLLKIAAKALAAEIAATWHDLGYDQVKAWTVEENTRAGVIYSVRSNLVDGLPPLGAPA